MILRRYYQVSDFVQLIWFRFAESRVGRGIIWFCTDGMLLLAKVTWLFVVLMWTWVRVGVIASVPVFKVMMKVLKWTFVASFIIGVGVLFIFLRFCTGKSKLAKVRR